MNGLPAAVCAGIAIWCSLGTIGLTGASTSARVALLAPWWILPLAIGAVLATIRLLRLSPREQSPLFGSALVILPWLPIPLPPAALLWTGPFMLAVWCAVVVGLLIARMRNSRARWAADPRLAPVVAAVLSLAFYGASAVWLSSILPDGDEPHYLILAQSLIKDGDLRIENNHRQGDYLAYSLTAAAPDYLRRGINGEIYSIHAPGLALLIAPAMWLFGYPGVVAFLGLIAAVSTALVWRVGWQTTGSAACAWFGWACCALTAPFFFQATEVFPDGIAATCLLIGTLPLWDVPRPNPSSAGDAPSSRPISLWVVSGAALAILPWLQTRLAVLAIAAAVCLCLRLRTVRQLVAFAAVPLISAALWFGFFIAVYGTPNPTAPYGPYTQTSLANLVRGWPGLLLDQQFGLIPNAPVYGFVLAALVVAAIRLRRWAWETMALTLPYMTAVGTYQMWWGGTSVPARLLTPITLVLGIAASRVWQDARTRATRTLGILTLIISVVITLTLLGPERGRLLLNFRDGISLWFEWANDVVDLPKGIPSLFHDGRAQLWLKVAVWGISGIALWLVLRVVESHGSESSWMSTSWISTSLISTCCAGVTVMIAFTLAWRVDGAQPLTPETAAVNVLRSATPFRSLAYDFGGGRFETSNVLASGLRIGTDLQRRPVHSPTIFGAREVPAGFYGLHFVSQQPSTGKLSVRAGSTQLALLTVPLPPTDEAPVLHLSTAVRALTIDADSARPAPLVELQPLGPARDARSDSAYQAVRYGPATVFFLDDHAYPEPTGFWVAGGRTATVVIAGHGGNGELFLRNAPVANEITVEINGDEQVLKLAPGEERLVAWPKMLQGESLRVRITSANGFRPSMLEPGSRDLRYLGCWIEVR